MEIRDFEYDIAALLGIAPSQAYLWIVPKRVLLAHALYQRRGASGKGSMWLKFHSNRPPEWLRHWGGTLTEAQRAFEQTGACSVTDR